MDISKCEYEYRNLVCKNVLIYTALLLPCLKVFEHLLLNSMHCYRYYNVS